ncbi:hypothetical protein, partial [Chroococcidiopsis sp [FACHB-1243]]|uniref:hypothetical protein n=1 Tax=Chroococcidiopsis sp. [FACHB-1243] TaxID=2692781 RepID=UPI001A7ED080
VSSIVNIYYFYSAQKLSHFGLLFYGDFLTFNTSDYIPYRTYNRLIKENNQVTKLSRDETDKSNVVEQSSKSRVDSETSRKYVGSLSDLAYCEAISERQKNERGSKLEWGLLNKIREYSSCQAKLLSLKNYSFSVPNGEFLHKLK